MSCPLVVGVFRWNVLLVCQLPATHVLDKFYAKLQVQVLYWREPVEQAHCSHAVESATRYPQIGGTHSAPSGSTYSLCWV